MESNLKERVAAWITEDQDPVSQAELQALLDEGRDDELADRFSGMLQFGTAGLRGLLGGGPNRMNRNVVLRATAGLCRYLLDVVPDAKSRGVCIGYDARRMSLEFARDAASVIAGHGITARLFDQRTPTPLLGFSVLEQNAAAGIVITASHNPPDYNGYKVFWGNGAQIIPPHDAGIAAAIESVESIASIPRLHEGPLYAPLGDECKSRYLDGVQAVQQHPEIARDVNIVYTAMHGVGGAFILQTLKRAGFESVTPVAEQQTPDGNFPTVAFPNPEEDGAMDLALAQAARSKADLVLANDPDADRLAGSVLHQGNYVPLTGNDIGCLLAHYLLENSKPLDTSKGDDRLVVCSIVSSPMLLSIGKFHGVRAEQTLTGHKWIQNRALDLAKEGFRYIFGYEEALGYGVGTQVRDKDGISAALAMADMAAWCKAQGRTLIDELEIMARRYGLFLSDQISLVLPGADGRVAIDAMMVAARTSSPTSLGGRAVLAVQDFERGIRRTSEGSETKLTLPTSDMVLFELEGGHRAMLRPSGTEPKIKHYIDVRVDLEAGESMASAKARGGELVRAIAADFVKG